MGKMIRETKIEEIYDTSLVQDLILEIPVMRFIKQEYKVKLTATIKLEKLDD